MEKFITAPKKVIKAAVPDWDLMHDLSLEGEGDEPDRTLAAVTELPLVLAAMAIASEGPSAPVTLAVTRCEHVDGSALLSSMFDRAKTRSLYEQARYTAGCEER